MFVILNFIFTIFPKTNIHKKKKIKKKKRKIKRREFRVYYRQKDQDVKMARESVACSIVQGIAQQYKNTEDVNRNIIR